MTNLDYLKYPVGTFRFPNEVRFSEISGLVDTIELFPSQVKTEVLSLSNHELDWRYRPDGWSIRQVVHHCADSHFNSFVRFKLALTEDTPTIKPYKEAAWASLTDSLGPIDSSLSILTGLHLRWCQLLKNLDEMDLKRTYFHPEQKRTIKLDETIALYAWHCKHHLGHIKLAKISREKYKSTIDGTA